MPTLQTFTTLLGDIRMTPLYVGDRLVSKLMRSGVETPLFQGNALIKGGGAALWRPLNDDGTAFDLYADLVNDSYGFEGTTYATYAEWLTAIGGSDLADPQFTFPWDTSVGTTIVEGLFPSSAAAVGNAFQVDDATDNSRVALQRDTNRIPGARVVRTGTTQLSLSFSPFRDWDSFKYAHSIGATADGGALVSLNGADATEDTSVNVPTVSIFRVGNNAAGDRPWTGQIWKIAVSRKRNSAAHIKTLSTQTLNFLADGDSYPGGAGGASMVMSLNRLFKTQILNTAEGSDELVNEVARVVANPLAGSVKMLFCDGSINGYDATTANDVALYQQAYDACSGNITIITPLARAGQTAPENAACKALTAALKASSMSARVFDLNAACDAITPGADGNCAASLLQGDTVHLTEAAWDALAPSIYTF